MTWTSDTIYSPDSTSIQVIPENLLVFSPGDAWLTCWNEVARGLLWHYDGTKWTESNIFADVGGMRVYDLAGSSSHDLWTGGYSGANIFLAHYNGAHWKASSDMGITGGILDMCTDPSGNIWACGRNGVIMKYDGVQWSVDTIKISFSYPVEYFLKSIQYYNSKFFVLASSINKNTLIEKYFYITGDMHNWTITDSMTLDSPSSEVKWGYRGLYASSFNSLYSYGLGGIWKYDNGSWNRIKYVNGAIDGMYGISENYLLAVGDFQNVLFFDGNNWTNISNNLDSEGSQYTFWNVWTNGSETFIVGFGQIGGVVKTIVWHGS